MFRAIFNKGIKSINVLTSEFCTKAPIARRYRGNLYKKNYINSVSRVIHTMLVI